MKLSLPRFRTVALAVLMLAVAGTALMGATPFHFALARSMPADKATVSEPPLVKLWFTEPPAEGTVSIRLIAPSGEPVSTADPAQDPEDPKAFSVTLPVVLAPGGYSVAWRGMGDDGHVVRGEFAFTVAGH